jgi:aryl-alcohol dehydrogenase-like predicted oxidoreductase
MYIFLLTPDRKVRIMKTRKLGWTALELTTVGIGTFPIGGAEWFAGWGPQDDRESIAMIQRALELGINWIDTAPVYGLGRAEQVVGDALKGVAKKPIIATKLGLVWDEHGEVSGVLKRESVRREVEASLRRLGIDVIDLYQIHWPRPDEDIEEAWTAMAELVQEGKVRYIAVSNCSVEQMERLGRIHRVASLQPPYSMIIRDVEDEILPYCGKNDIGVVPYSPMQRGLLTGKFTKERVAALDKRDHRLREPYFQEPQLSINLEFVDRLRSIADKRGKTLAQLSIAWVLRIPEVTAAIVGARRPSQIEETAGAADWELDDEEIKKIDALLEERERRIQSTT